MEEFNGKVEESQRMTAVEKAELDVIIQKLQNKLNYHSSTFSDAQFKLTQKVSRATRTTPVEVDAAERLVGGSQTTQQSAHLSFPVLPVQLLSWPLEYVGPVLNLMRLFVLHPHVAQVYSKQVVEEKRQTEDIVSTLNRVVTTAEKSVTALLAVRVLCNLFRSPQTSTA